MAVIKFLGSHKKEEKRWCCLGTWPGMTLTRSRAPTRPMIECDDYDVARVVGEEGGKKRDIKALNNMTLSGGVSLDLMLDLMVSMWIKTKVINSISGRPLFISSSLFHTHVVIKGGSRFYYY